MSQIALLCGAPGLGKTTLAHVIAQHAGYNVVEMNARYVCVCGGGGWGGELDDAGVVEGRLMVSL